MRALGIRFSPTWTLRSDRSVSDVADVASPRVELLCIIAQSRVSDVASPRVELPRIIAQSRDVLATHWPCTNVAENVLEFRKLRGKLSLAAIH